jgi:two-component system OmpR family response regulator
VGANTLVKDLEKSWDEIDQALKALRADPPKLTDCKHITRFFAGHAIWVIPAIIGIGSLCGSEHTRKHYSPSFLRAFCCSSKQLPERRIELSLSVGGEMRVLLIEDDAMIGEAIHGALKDASYAADWVKNGQTALTTLGCQHYDLVLLDLGLPGKDGLEVLTSIRAKDNPVPLLIITARDGLDDRLRGLDGGADDYVLKPFEMAELLARMRAVLRRKGGSATPMLSNGVVSLDQATREAAVNDSAPMQLSSREFALLQALLVRPGAILSRSDLEDRIYGWGEEVGSNAVEFLIHALRRKLGSEVIKNVRGAGWMVSKNA